MAVQEQTPASEPERFVDEFARVISEAMENPTYFNDEGVPEAYRIPWPGLDFRQVLEDPEILHEKLFVLLTSQTTGLGMLIVQTDPRVWTIDVEEKGGKKEYGAQFVVYDPLHMEMPPIVVCQDSSGNKRLVTRSPVNVFESSLPTVEELQSSIREYREFSHLDKDSDAWSAFICDVLKRKTVKPGVESMPIHEKERQMRYERIKGDLIMILYANITLVSL